MKRRIVYVALLVILTVALATLTLAFVRLTPDVVLTYAHTDTYGEVRAAIARARAGFWSSCPAADFQPTTPLGAIAASLEGSSAKQEASILSIADVMLAKGCDINEFAGTGMTPLLDAVLFGDPLAVRALLSRGADPMLRKKPSTNKRPSPIDGMNAAELATFLLDRPAGPTGNRKAVLDYVTRIPSNGA